jgi:hypothetical protein
MRGNDQDREVEVTEIVLPEVATVIEVEPLRWGGAGISSRLPAWLS